MARIDDLSSFFLLFFQSIEHQRNLRRLHGYKEEILSFRHYMKSSNEILQKWASIIQVDSPEFVDGLDNVPVSVAQTITAKTYNRTMFQDDVSSPKKLFPQV